MAHLEKSLQRDIDLIRGKITEMSARDEQALKTAVRALQEQNRQLAYVVILRDQHIDELEKEVDRLCLEFLIRQQPVAGHLRFVYAAIKINAELERIGDYAESIARQVIKLGSVELPVSPDRFVEIANFSVPMLHNATQAFVKQDAELARSTMVVEDQVDVLRNKLNADLLTHLQQGKLPLEALTPLMTIARRLERVSDQAKNICEETLYMCTGEYSKHKGTEVMRILFVSERNSCRSQMAEAIGNSLDEPRLLFSSAGINPKAVDPATVRFLAEKGLDASRANSKSIAQIPNLEHYHVIIALDKAAQKAFPTPPTKTVTLDWNVVDPSAVQGSPEAIRIAYETTCEHIQTHIKELTEAILGSNND